MRCMGCHGVWCLYSRTERVYWEQAGGRLWIYVWLHVFSGAWTVLYLGLDSPWWRKLLSGSKAGTFRKFINPLAPGALLLAFSPSTLESKFPALAKPTSPSILCIVQTPLPLHWRVFRTGMFSSPKQVPGLKSSTLDSSFSKEVFPSHSVSLEHPTQNSCCLQELPWSPLYPSPQQFLVSAHLFCGFQNKILCKRSVH